VLIDSDLYQRVLGAELQGSATGPPKHRGHADLAVRHVPHLGRGVDQLIHGEQGEVPGHELDHRTETDHGGPDPDAGETQLSDGRVHDPHGSELVEQSTAHLVGALIHPDLLTHEEDRVVTLHLLAKRLVQRISVCECRHT
jgi:hypothetical protein